MQNNMITVTEAMKTSPFGKLPAEIRNEMYELVLVKPGGIPVMIGFANRKEPGASVKLWSKHVTHAPLRGPRMDMDNIEDRRNFLALTATCKQVRTESFSIFLASNTFHVMVDQVSVRTRPRDATLQIRGWLSYLGESVDCLRNVHLYSGVWAADSFSADAFVDSLKDIKAAFRHLPDTRISYFAEFSFGLPRHLLLDFDLPIISLNHSDHNAAVTALLNVVTASVNTLNAAHEMSRGYSTFASEADYRLANTKRLLKDWQAGMEQLYHLLTLDPVWHWQAEGEAEGKTEGKIEAKV